MLGYAYLKIVNIYIFYEINKNYNINSYPTLENFLFRTVKLTKNIDIDECKYTRIGFDRKGTFSVDNGFGRNCIIFWSRYEFFCTCWQKEENNILILGEGSTKGLDGTTLTAEENIQLILLKIIRNFVWACIIIEQIVLYLLMVQKFLNLNKRLWNCSNSIMFRKHFKSLFYW